MGETKHQKWVVYYCFTHISDDLKCVNDLKRCFLCLREDEEFDPMEIRTTSLELIRMTEAQAPLFSLSVSGIHIPYPGIGSGSELLCASQVR